ncbi:YiiX/YebB-like N1pC/P60 family cysteine hydrolase [Flavobacterium sp. N2270]|uniref:YiiX/YebB-like N1pC/P60 family cysteine hydrolase n=1 Tax=Flavobacterium sp. N2270 TaxID=2986831 RepID=UPI0022254F07|nr:YiiX/YebB-like N1pC/P60 family cysteine hydrolase [Flavobacterium sp. N2270]
MKFSAFILILISQLSFAQNVKLKTGDLIFQSMNCGPLCDAINQVTEGYKGKDFSHLGLVYIQNDSIYIIEAAGNAVQLTPLEKFKSYTKETMFVGRLKRKFRKYIPEAITFSLNQMGVPYDEAYLYNNGSYYCSELIYDAFLDAYKKPFFELQAMTFKAPNSDTYFEVWQEYYDKLEIEIPEGKLGCNPGGISTSNKLKIIGTLD